MPSNGHADDRQIVQILAFAGREFDRVRDLLVRDDEPATPASDDDVPEIAPVGVPAGSEGDDPDQAEPAGDVPDLGGARDGGRKDDHGARARDDRRDEGQDEDGGHEHGLLRGALGAAATVARTAGRLTVGSVHPGHPDWASVSVDDRIDWWVERFGTAAAALAAVPGLGGKLGRMTGAGDIVATAGQVLLVHAVGREMGVTDLGRRVTAAAGVVFGHALDQSVVHSALGDAEAQPEDDMPGTSDAERRGPIARVGRTAALVWRVAGRLRRLRSAMDNRPKGGRVNQFLADLPGVGAVAAFASERRGMSAAAERAQAAFNA